MTEKKVTAKDITASMMANLRFTKKINLLATEVGRFSSDILGLNADKGLFVEVEVKISKSDLMNDFKKYKHEYYLHQYKNKEPLKDSRHWKWYNSFVPKQFFFAVPEYMLEYTLNAVEGLPYGVICYRHSKIAHFRRVRVEKRAKKLHDKPVPPNVIDDVLLRMSSELSNFHIDEAVRRWKS